MSVTLALEYEDVLTRPEQLQAAWISRDEVETLIAGLLTAAIQIDPPAYNGPPLIDERDRHVISLAVAGNADALVTHNVRHFQNVTEIAGGRIIYTGRAASPAEESAAMTQQISVRLSDSQAEQVHAIASQSRVTPEEVALEALDTGLHTIRRRQFYERAADSGAVDKALEILQQRSGDGPPIPGDELP